MNDFKHYFYQKLLDLRIPKDDSKYFNWWPEEYPLPIEGCTLCLLYTSDAADE